MDLSCSIRILAVDYFVLSQFVRLTDGQTGRSATAVPCVCIWFTNSKSQRLFNWYPNWWAWM